MMLPPFSVCTSDSSRLSRASHYIRETTLTVSCHIHFQPKTSFHMELTAAALSSQRSPCRAVRSSMPPYLAPTALQRPGDSPLTALYPQVLLPQAHHRHLPPRQSGLFRHHQRHPRYLLQLLRRQFHCPWHHLHCCHP